MVNISLLRVKKGLGFAEQCGDSLTRVVLDADTLKIIYRSALRPRNLKDPNKRLVAVGGEEDHQPHSKHTTYMPDGKHIIPVTEVCHLGHFWRSYGRCVTSGSPIGLLVGTLRRQTDQATPRKNLPSCMFLEVLWLLQCLEHLQDV